MTLQTVMKNVSAYFNHSIKRVRANTAKAHIC